jgi:hypothetical protein
MFTSQFSFKKGTCMYFSLLIMGLNTLFLASCKSKEETPKDFLMYCRQLNKTDIQNSWVSKDWTRPGNANFITQLWFNVNKIDTKIQIDVNPMKSYDQFILGGGITLSRDTDCSESLPANAEYVDNWVSFDSLHLTNPDGSLINFDLVRLTPSKDYPPYVNYKIEVISTAGGSDNVLFKAVSYPCPPHCPKPPSVDE